MLRCLSLLCLLLPTPLCVAAERPNVIVIMTDDQGYGDFGVTGNPVIRTPHLDALAEASASLSNFYVSPVCAPTRASLMTGRYNYRTRVVDTFKGRAMMEPEEVTVAEVLQQAGYATGIFGKWHLGDNYPLRPIDQGFDTSLIHAGGGLAQPSEPLENKRRYTDPILFRNGQQVQTEGYCTDVYFEAARDFIDRNQAADRPFFIYLPTNAPHGPYHDVPQQLYDYYKSIDLTPVLEGRPQDADRVARIFAMIENVDQNVGQLRAHLAERKLSDNTLLMFLVDNGPNTRRYVGPFRGKKAEVHEGGIRSPLWAHWPARLPAGTTSDRIAAHLDVMPTVLAAAGVAVPEDLELDGRNLLPLLEGRDPAWPDRQLVIQAHRGNAPVPFHHFALRTQRWKLLHPTGFGRETMPENVPFELYDMATDQGETINLAESRPERVEALKAKYLAWFEDVSSTRPDNYAPPRIVIGTDQDPLSVLTKQDWRPGATPGWGSRGKWLVTAQQPATYDVDVVWEAPLGPARATLHVGDRDYPIQWQASRQRLEFDGIEIPAGETSIGVTATADGKPRDPYHVRLRRQD